MKKQIIAILALIVVSIILPMSAMAITKTEWEQSCDTKMGETATLYAVDTAEDGSQTLREVGSILAGTYIMVDRGDKELNIKYIRYYQNDGIVSGIISRNASLKNASKYVWFTDGTFTMVPERVALDSAALKRWLSISDPGRKVYAISNPGQASPLEFPQTLDTTQTTILDDEAADAVNPGGSLPTATSVPAKDPSTDTSGYVEGEWAGAGEVSAEEQAFNATCGRRLKRTVWGYSDAHMTKKYEKINIGTYCDIVIDFNDVVKIAYYKNGEKHEAHIERADLVGSYTQYTSQDGTVQGWISTADPNYAAVVAENVVDYEAEDIQSDLNSQVAAEQAGQTSKKVSVTTIGVVNSTIVVDRKNREIPTSELSFGTEVPAGKQIAVIHAPKSGKCSLHKTSSNSSKVLKKCKAGTVVVILEYGSNKCKINYNGTVGYVATNCLKFYGTDVKTEGTGTLTYKGKATGKTTINVHNTPDKGSATIADWKTGTQVTVFGHENGWYEIEYRGMHGYARVCDG